MGLFQRSKANHGVVTRAKVVPVTVRALKHRNFRTLISRLSPWRTDGRVGPSFTVRHVRCRVFACDHRGPQ